MYIADWGNERVQVLDPDGQFVQKLRGQATESKWAKIFLNVNKEEGVARKRADLEPEIDLFDPDDPHEESSHIEKLFWAPVSIKLDDSEQVVRHRGQSSQNPDLPAGVIVPTSREHHDVVVIGGGPGGSAAATLLARRGHRVVLLERERFPRDHVGESLLPASMPVLEELGVLTQMEREGFPKKWGATMLWGQRPRTLELVLQRDQPRISTRLSGVETDFRQDTPGQRPRGVRGR